MAETEPVVQFENVQKSYDGEILVVKDGTIAISLGAYGVPETYVLDKNKKILNKFVGPLNPQLLKEIENLIK